MTRRTPTWLLATALAVVSPACGDSGPGPGTETSSETETDSEGGDLEGTECPLQGMYDACGIDGGVGRIYCDNFGGDLLWGPCLAEWDCELDQGGGSCETCQLLDGKPTIFVITGPYCY